MSRKFLSKSPFFLLVSLILIGVFSSLSFVPKANASYNNVIVNGGFELGNTDYWNMNDTAIQNGTTSYSVTSSYHNTGTYALLVNVWSTIQNCSFSQIVSGYPSVSQIANLTFYATVVSGYSQYHVNLTVTYSDSSYSIQTFSVTTAYWGDGIFTFTNFTSGKNVAKITFTATQEAILTVALFDDITLFAQSVTPIVFNNLLFNNLSCNTTQININNNIIYENESVKLSVFQYGDSYIWKIDFDMAVYPQQGSPFEFIMYNTTGQPTTEYYGVYATYIDTSTCNIQLTFNGVYFSVPMTSDVGALHSFEYVIIYNTTTNQYHQQLQVFNYDKIHFPQPLVTLQLLHMVEPHSFVPNNYLIIAMGGTYSYGRIMNRCIYKCVAVGYVSYMFVITPTPVEQTETTFSLYQSQSYLYTGYITINSSLASNGTYQIQSTGLRNTMIPSFGVYTYTYVLNGTILNGAFTFQFSPRVSLYLTVYESIIVNWQSGNVSQSFNYLVTWIRYIAPTPTDNSNTQGYGFGNPELLTTVLVDFLLFLVPTLSLGLYFGRNGFFVGLVLATGIGITTGLMPIWLAFLLAIGLVALLFNNTGAGEWIGDRIRS